MALVVYWSTIKSEALFYLKAAGSNKICPAMFCNKSTPRIPHLHAIQRERQRVYVNAKFFHLSES